MFWRTWHACMNREALVFSRPVTKPKPERFHVKSQFVTILALPQKDSSTTSMIIFAAYKVPYRQIDATTSVLMAQHATISHSVHAACIIGIAADSANVESAIESADPAPGSAPPATAASIARSPLCIHALKFCTVLHLSSYSSTQLPLCHHSHFHVAIRACCKGNY